MHKSIKTLFVGTALAGSVLAGLAYAMPPGGGPGCAHGAGARGLGHHGLDSESAVERMTQRLDLSTEQRDKVRAIVDKARPQMRALRDQLSDNRQKLRALMQSGNAKEADIRKLADTQGKLMADKIVQRSRVHNEINAVLTPEQRETWQQQSGRHGRFSFHDPRTDHHDRPEGTS